MTGNSMGTLFKITSFGESHGKVIGIIVEGVPAGLNIDVNFIQEELNRRRPGTSEISTPRIEEDQLEILSGVFNNYSTGAPICMTIKNRDIRSKDYDLLKDNPRPGHADLVANFKYCGLNDYRGGGRFSGRITAGFVMAGAIAKLILATKNIEINAFTTQIGEIKANISDLRNIKQLKNKNLVYCPDQNAAQKMIEKILQIKKENDSIGGIIKCIINGVPIGVGEPVFNSLESELSKAIFSIPGIKAIEFGLGFKSVNLTGSQNNDNFIIKNGKISTETNNAGGILGGISFGSPIEFNVAIKPTSSIGKAQKTINLKEFKEIKLEIPGRHDPCIVPRAVSVIEAMAAIVLIDLMMQAGMIDTIIFSPIENIEYQRKSIDIVTINMLKLLKNRIESSKIIGKIKLNQKSIIQDKKREEELINLGINYAKEIGLDQEIAKNFIKYIIQESIKIQNTLVKNKN